MIEIQHLKFISQKMEGMLTSGVKLGSVHPLVRALFSEVESFTFLSERDRLGVEGFFEHLQ